jgi:YD repeat-containing protein
MRTIILLALITLPMSALAQQRAIYDANGRIIGQEATDSQGTVTTYDQNGRAVTRESPTSNGTTVYDARTGNALGRVTKERQR